MNFIFLHTVKKKQVLYIILTRAKQAMILFMHFAWITAVFLIQVIFNVTNPEAKLLGDLMNTTSFYNFYNFYSPPSKSTLKFELVDIFRNPNFSKPFSKLQRGWRGGGEMFKLSI